VASLTEISRDGSSPLAARTIDLFTEHVHALGALREGDGVVAGLLLATSIATSLAM
jgi:hypothetical protein